MKRFLMSTVGALLLMTAVPMAAHAESCTGDFNNLCEGVFQARALVCERVHKVC